MGIMKWRFVRSQKRAHGRTSLSRETARLPGSSLEVGAYVPGRYSAHDPPSTEANLDRAAPPVSAIRLARRRASSLGQSPSAWISDVNIPLPRRPAPKVVDSMQ
jgi:hypothetical protein